MRQDQRSFYSTSDGYLAALVARDANTFKGYISLLSRYAKQSYRVLDVGCRTGYSSLLLAKAGFSVVGEDISYKFLEAGCGLFEDSLRFVCADASEQLFADSSFEVVTSTDFLEHVLDGQKVLSEMKRILKPDGICIVMCPNLLSPFRPLWYLAKMLIGKGRTAVWGESPMSALKQCFRNMVTLLNRKSRGEGFIYRRPCLDPDADGNYGGDMDAAFVTNPVDLCRWFEANGFLLEHSFSYPESALRKILRRTLPDFTTPVIIVAIKHQVEKGRI